MTKIVLEINCGDSKPPVLTENLLCLENISGLPFSLNILLVFETLPSQRKITSCFLCLTSLFSVILCRFLLFFCGISAIFPFWYPSIRRYVGVWKCTGLPRLCARFAFIHGMLSWRSISSLILCLFNEKV